MKPDCKFAYKLASKSGEIQRLGFHLHLFYFVALSSKQVLTIFWGAEWGMGWRHLSSATLGPGSSYSPRQVEGIWLRYIIIRSPYTPYSIYLRGTGGVCCQGSRLTAIPSTGLVGIPICSIVHTFQAECQKDLCCNVGCCSALLHDGCHV